jgi:type I restriction enzyme, S subunit
MSITADAAFEPVEIASASEVPEGWEHALISEIFDSWGGMTPSTANSSYWGGDIPWISSKDMKSTRIKCGADFITQKGLQEARLRMCPAGSVLTVVRSGILANTFPVAITESPVTINQDLKAFWSSEPSLNEWLSIALRGMAPRILEENRKDGTTVQSIRVNQLVNLTVAVPPLDEQKRISAAIQRLTENIVAAKARLSKARGCLAQFRQAVLRAACSGRLTEKWRHAHVSAESATQLLEKIAEEKARKGIRKSVRVGSDRESFLFRLPTSWAVCGLDDIAASNKHAIKAGPFGSSLTKASYVSSGYKIYGQEQVINGDPNFGNYYISEEKFKKLQSCAVAAGDILVSLVGTIGRVLIIPDKFEPGIINPRLVKLSFHRSIIRRYLSLYFASPLAKEVLSHQSHGGTMEILNLEILRRLPIPLPPAAEQCAIVRRVEALFSLANKIEKRVAAASLRAERLTQAVLAKALRGELVPTEAELARREGRTYKPASALLERIKSERARLSENGARRRNGRK